MAAKAVKHTAGRMTRLLMVAVACASLCFGCSGPVSGRVAGNLLADQDRYVLSDYVAVIPFSVATVSRKNHQYLAFIREDGSYKLMKTGRMLSMLPYWDETGLYFTDEDLDYRIDWSGEVTTWENPKEDPLNSAVAKDADGNIVNAYDNGMLAGGANAVTMTFRKGDSMEKREIVFDDGPVTMMTSCPSGIYTVSNSPKKKDGNAILNLRRFRKPEHITMKKAGEQLLGRGYDEQTGRFEYGNEMALWGEYSTPCRDDVMHYVTSQRVERLYGVDGEFDESRFLVTMNTWNVLTGDVTTIPVTDDAGEPLYDSADAGFNTASSDPQALQGDELLAANASTGQVIAVNIHTGVYREAVKASVPDKSPRWGRNYMNTGEKAFTLITIPSTDKFRKTITISRYSRKDGKLLQTIEADDSLTLPFAPDYISVAPVTNPRIL